jgi:hypothetical protein
MKVRFTAFSLLAALAMVSLTATVFAQDTTDTMPAHPRYAKRTPHLRSDIAAPATPLTTWNGQFVFHNVTYKYNMVGTAPRTGTSTTVNTFLIPIALTYTSGGTTTTFSPAHVLTNGQTVIKNTQQSPIFQSGVDFVTGGIDLGNTQYTDAFQRGNFWGQVQSNPGYHVLLGQPKVAPVQTFAVPPADGSLGTEFGVKVGLVDINWLDGKLQGIINQVKQINPTTLPIFITYDVYVTDFGCCIGGYHSSMGSTAAPQAYSYFTYIDKPVFGQDVSALSHEVSEWMDDPLVVNINGNSVQCGILEVGDPEEGFANNGAFPYTLNGFTYNLQDETYLPYFGAPTSTSANGSLTFQGNPFHLGVCTNGG